jgi:hypothetical protein
MVSYLISLCSTQKHLQDEVLLGLEDFFKRQVHEHRAIFIQLPFQDRKVRLDRCCVGKHGHQPATEQAQVLKSTRGIVPRVIEPGRVIVFVDDVAQDGVGVVKLEKFAMLGLNLLHALLVLE